MSFRELFPSVPMVPDKVEPPRISHEELQQQTEEFLAKGGKITQVESHDRVHQYLPRRNFVINGKRDSARLEAKLNNRRRHA